MEYLDFEVSVDTPLGGEYQVRARAPSGEARDRTRLPFQLDDLNAQLEVVQRALTATRSARDVVVTQEEPSSIAEQRATLERFGQTLFESLLTGRVLMAWRSSLAVAAQRQCGLRLQLRLQPPEMAALPWELMYDPDDAAFVCLNPDTPVVRYPEMEHAAELLTVKPPLRVLGMIASPQSLPPLDKEAERARIEKALADLQRDGMVELHWLEGSTYSDLQQAMRGGPWHVFHFIGHGGFEPGTGAGRGVLALEATPTMAVPAIDPGKPSKGSATAAHFVPAETLGQLLRGHPSLRLVLLNSCLGARCDAGDLFSSTASTLIRRGIPAVIAMQNEITDRAAIVFAQAFYASLAAWIPVDRAVTDARAAMSAANRESLEWGTPVLMMRSPNGMLFTPPSETSQLETTDGKMGERPGTRSGFRIRPALAFALIGLPLIVAALLGWTTVPNTDLGMYAKVSRFAVTLPTREALDVRIAVSSLGISGLSGAELPTDEGSKSISTDFLRLTALNQRGSQGRLTLDLSEALPAGTVVALSATDSAGTYLLELRDSVPSMTIGAVGPVAVRGEEIEERLNFRTPATIRLAPDRGTLGIEFKPVPAGRRLFTQQLPAHGLDLIKVNHFESESGTTLDETSTILAGHIVIGTAEPRELAPAEEIRATGVRGELTNVWLDGDHLELVMRGNVKKLFSGAGDVREDLTPSLLEWLKADHPVWLAVGAAAYALLAALILAMRSRGAR